MAETNLLGAGGPEARKENEGEETKGEEEEGEKWVQAVEMVCQLIPKGLPFLVAKKGFGEYEAKHCSFF